MVLCCYDGINIHSLECIFNLYSELLEKHDLSDEGQLPPAHPPPTPSLPLPRPSLFFFSSPSFLGHRTGSRSQTERVSQHSCNKADPLHKVVEHASSAQLLLLLSCFVVQSVVRPGWRGGILSTPRFRGRRRRLGRAEELWATTETGEACTTCSGGSLQTRTNCSKIKKNFIEEIPSLNPKMN